MVDARTPHARIDRAVIEPPLDLNTATAEQLKEIKGIGEGKAARIVAWREAGGRFAAVADLQKVPGFTADDVRRLGGELTV